MITVLLIGLALCVAGSLAMWALCAYAGHLDDQADRAEDGKSDASHALGQVKVSILAEDRMSPAIAHLTDQAWIHPLAPSWTSAVPVSAGAGRCGVNGPCSMRCDQPPQHGGARHEQDGYGWYTPAGEFPSLGGRRG